MKRNRPNKTHRCSKVVAAACVLMCGAQQSVAEPMSLSGQNENEWRHVVTGYAFLPARTWGTSTVAGTGVDLDLSLKDVLDNDLLDFALAGRYEAWKGNFGLIVDANYVRLGAVISPAPIVDLDADIQQAWLGFMAAYRVVNTTYGDDGRWVSVDLQGGARYNKLKQVFDVTTPGPTTRLGGTERWWEPVIGGRVMWQINDKWAGAVAADFGGFGVGDNDLQVIATAGVSYRAWDNTSIRLGYRYYSIDFSTDRSDGEFGLDTSQHGPYVGITWQF